eukprot:397263-Amphidinium_carterae.1
MPSSCGSRKACQQLPQRKRLAGPGVVRAGGATDPRHDSDRPDLMNEKVACNWHSLPRTFYEELLHSYSSCVVLCATMLDELPALAAVTARVPFIGICLNQKHKEMVSKKTIEAVFNEMRDPDSSTHDGKLSKLIGQKKSQSTRVPKPH